MPARALDAHFSRRMIPLAIIAGLTIATVPPAIYGAIAWHKLTHQGDIYAGLVAAGVRQAVFQQPLLWRYNAPKIFEAMIPHRHQRDIAEITITDCLGESVASSTAARIGSGAAGGPTGRADVVVRGEASATVLVRMDVSEYRSMLLRVAALFVPLGSAICLLLSIFPTRVVRRQSAQLAAAHQALATSNEHLEQRVAQGVARIRTLSQRVVQSQEDERRRIARDLHDGLGQAITGLQMEFELARATPAQTQQRVDDAIGHCAEMLAELRRIVQELRPIELETNDLPEALRGCAEVFELRSGIHTYFRCRGTGDYSQQTASCFLRILQEALTNVRRHAGATEVGVSLTLDAPLGTLEINDDGSGFDPSGAASGAGLRGIRERCELVGGSLALHSGPSEGTRLVIHLPLQESGGGASGKGDEI